MPNKIVYLHLYAKTQNIFYVGIGKPGRENDFIRRSKAWFRYVQDNGYPIVWIVADRLSIENAGKIEKSLIINYGRKGIDPNGILVNKVTGLGAAGAVYTAERNRKVSKSKIGFKFSPESKLKMSRSHKGKSLSEDHKQKIGDSVRGVKNGRYGVILTDETRQKLRVANLGKRQTKETIEKRIQSIRKRKIKCQLI